MSSALKWLGFVAPGAAFPRRSVIGSIDAITLKPISIGAGRRGFGT